MYRVNQIFHTLQGEGVNTGCSAVFIRFSGCNLWSGTEPGRKKAVCKFCDTFFTYFKEMSLEEIAEKVVTEWRRKVPDYRGSGFAVLTGGEPLLQVNAPLLGVLHDAGFDVAVETNGTIVAPDGLDWITVSPKAGAPLKQLHGDELKLVYPQADLTPVDLEERGDLKFDFWVLQPMWHQNPEVAQTNIRDAADYCSRNPKWKLGLQIHKILGLP